MRRLIRVFAVLGLLLGTVVSLAAPAVAASVSGGAQVGVTVCVSASKYPPSSGATLQVSTTTPYRGERIEVAGSDYCPNEKVKLTLAGRIVGAARTNSSGSFDPEITVDVAPGTYRLTGTGAQGDSASVTLTVRQGAGIAGVATSRAPSGGGAAAGQGSGGLAFTGVDIAMLLAAAVVLIGGGGYLAHAGRRRHGRRT